MTEMRSEKRLLVVKKNITLTNSLTHNFLEILDTNIFCLFCIRLIEYHKANRIYNLFLCKAYLLQ